MWTDAADPSGYRMGKSKEHVHPNTNPQKSENHQSGRRHRHNFFGITSLFFFSFFLASSSSSAGYRITQSSTCAWISAHICVRVSYFLESPPDSFQIFLASFEFIWITTVRLIAGGELLPNWIPWRFHLLIGPVVLADQLVYQFLVWKTSGDSNSIGLTPPFLVVLEKNCPAVDIYDVQTDMCTAQPT